MNELLMSIMPNVVEYFPEMMKAIGDTFNMVAWATIIACAIGIPLGVALLVTSPGHILEHKVIYSIASKITNILRSIPFVILIAFAAPFTRMVVGTTIGTKGAIVPLVIGVTPFIARQIEAALQKIDHGVIEAARAMGQTPFQIITRVILREGLAGIINAITISVVSLIGYSAMAGTIGAGGLGDFAIKYGYNYYKTDIMIVTVILMVLLVSGVQKLGEIIVRKITH